MGLIDPERTAGQELQGILGISHQTVARLQKAGLLVSIGAGKFRLAEAVQAYVAYVDGGHATTDTADRKRQVLDEQHRKLKIANDARASERSFRWLRPSRWRTKRSGLGRPDGVLAARPRGAMGRNRPRAGLAGPGRVVGDGLWRATYRSDAGRLGVPPG